MLMQLVDLGEPAPLEKQHFTLYKLKASEAKQKYDEEMAHDYNENT